MSILMPRHTQWPDVASRLPTLLKDLDETELEIVRLRWLEKAARGDSQWRSHRMAYYGFRVQIIIGAATVPVLASLDVANVVTALVGLVVAILTGLDSFFRYGLRWQQQRRSAVELESEGWEFLELSGEYAEFESHNAALRTFLGNLEESNKRLALTYLDLFGEASPSRPEKPAMTTDKPATESPG